MQVKGLGSDLDLLFLVLSRQIIAGESIILDKNAANVLETSLVARDTIGPK